MKSKERITRTENDNIISNDEKVAETFQKFFGNTEKPLNVSGTPEFISEISKNDPVPIY